MTAQAEAAVALLWCEEDDSGAKWAICLPSFLEGPAGPPLKSAVWFYTALDCFSDVSGSLWLAEDLDSRVRYEIAPGGWLSRVRL